MPTHPEVSMSATILPFDRPLSIGEVLDAGIALFKASLLRCLPLSLVAVVLAGSVFAQEMPKPGKEHEQLKKLEGTWDTTMHMGGKDEMGTTVYKMELGGFWLTSALESKIEGFAFVGKGSDGYCPIRKKYVSIWTDSTNPSSETRRPLTTAMAPCRAKYSFSNTASRYRGARACSGRDAMSSSVPSASMNRQNSSGERLNSGVSSMSGAAD